MRCIEEYTPRKMKSPSDSYENFRSLVGNLFSSAISARGHSPGQAFAYAYDELEGIISEGVLQRIFILTALFVCAKENAVPMDIDDPFTECAIDELRGAIAEFDAAGLKKDEFAHLSSDLSDIQSEYLGANSSQ